MAIKPGTPHPNKKGMVMGKNGRYVSKTTYNKQVKAAKPSTAKPEKGGALAKTKQAKPDNPRRTRALAKQAQAAKGSKGSGTRVAQPTQKALPPGKTGGALAKTAKGAKGLAAKVTVPLGMVAEVNEMVDRAKRDAERNKKLNRRPFEELRADRRQNTTTGRTRKQQAKPPTVSIPKPTPRTRQGRVKPSEPKIKGGDYKSRFAGARDKAFAKASKIEPTTPKATSKSKPAPAPKPTPKPAAKKPAPKSTPKPASKPTPGANKAGYEGPGSRGQAPGGYAGKPKKQSLKSQVEELKKMRMAAEARNKAAAAKKKEEEKKKNRTMGSRKPGSMY